MVSVHDSANKSESKSPAARKKLRKVSNKQIFNEPVRTTRMADTARRMSINSALSDLLQLGSVGENTLPSDQISLGLTGRFNPKNRRKSSRQVFSPQLKTRNKMLIRGSTVVSE